MTVAFPGVNGGPSGWICPKCGMVYAPWVATCNQCVQLPQTITYGKKTTVIVETGVPDWQGNHEASR